MATATEPTRTKRQAGPGEQRMVLSGVSWQTYEALGREVRDRSLRMAYDRGRLEIMSPHPPHERYKKLFARLVEEILTGLRIPAETAGSSRWERQAAERGLEPDECYFLAPEKLAIVGGRPADRPGDPVPDLAIEVDLSEPQVDRRAIYAALGVPEVWRFDGEALKIDRLRPDGTYEERAESQFLPITPREVLDWIERADGLDVITWSEQLRTWIRDDLAPRARRA